jgi:hypothetical protein
VLFEQERRDQEAAEYKEHVEGQAARPIRREVIVDRQERQKPQTSYSIQRRTMTEARGSWLGEGGHATDGTSTTRNRHIGRLGAPK